VADKFIRTVRELENELNLLVLDAQSSALESMLIDVSDHERSFGHMN
jgi:hypothetical protein